MPDHDRIEGTAEQAGGNINETVGKITGDEKRQAEGKADQVEGKVRTLGGGIKDALRGKD